MDYKRGVFLQSPNKLNILWKLEGKSLKSLQLQAAHFDFTSVRRIGPLVTVPPSLALPLHFGRFIKGGMFATRERERERKKKGAEGEGWQQSESPTIKDGEN